MEKKLHYPQTISVLVFLPFLFFINVIIAQKTSTGSTDWNNANTWSPSGVPGPSDPVIIRPGDIVTVNSTPMNAVASLTFNNTATNTSGISVANGVILTVTGAVSLLNSQIRDTNASISGMGTLLCGSLNVGIPTVNTTGGTFYNTLTINISTLNVSGDITSNNDDPGGKSSQPIWNINSPCNLSANSIIFSHTGSASAGQTKSYFNVGSGVTVNLAAATPIVVDYNINNFRSTMVTVDVNPNSTFNFCGSSSVPTSIPNSGGTTNTNLSITYGNTNTGNDITLTSGIGTNTPTTPINVSMLNITYSTTGATGATFSGLPPGVSGSWVSGVVTISGTPTSVGTYNYTVTTIAAGACTQKSATGTITTYICPTFSLLSTTSSNVNVCLGSSSLVTLTSTASGLPIGSYTVSYEIQGVVQTPSPMTVVAAGSGSFVDSGFTSVGSRTITITNITSGLCSSAINTNNIDTVTVVASLAAPTSSAGSGATCNEITANWQPMADATYYELDVSTSSSFSSFVSGYNALNVGLTTSYTVTGLASGTTYYYRVRAFNGLCISSSSSSVTYATTVLPGTVTSNAATLLNCTGFNANWTAATNATSYLLDVSTSNTFAAGNFIGIYNAYDVGNSTTLAVTGLTPGTIYYYRVKAKNGCGISSSFSSTRNATTSNSVPTTVSSNAATLISCDRFTANWTATASATSYLLDVSTSNVFAAGNFVGVYNSFDVGNITTLTFSGLTAGTTYYYRVKAKNGCGVSASYSTVRNLTTLNVVPGTVTANNATTISCDGFTANWTSLAAATSYQLDISTSNVFAAGNFVGIYNGFDVGNNTSLVVTGLSPGTTYYYRVKAVNSCGISAAYSNVKNALILSALPGTVTSNSATSTICDSFTANWTSLAAATNYLLDVSTSSTFAAGNFVGVFNNFDVGNVTNYTVTGLAANTTYYYRVKAENGCGISAAFSTTRSTTTLALPNTPAVSASGSLTFCQTDSVTLGSTVTGSSYIWYLNGVAISGETSQFLFVSTAGDYTVRVINASGCQSALSLPANVSLQGLPTALAGGSQTICSNGVATVTGASATNGTIFWTENGAGSITAGATTLTPTYTPAPGDIGNTVILTMTVTSNNSCTPQIETDTYSITVTPAIAAPTISTITQPVSCSFATGSVLLINLPVGGIINPGAISYTGTTCTISGLTPGIYNYTVTSGTCTSPASSDVLINPITLIDNKWTSSGWSRGFPPSSDSERIIFEAPTFSSTVDLVGCSCQINSGVTVTINSGHNLTLTNEITNYGTLTLENSASLIQINDNAINSGNVIVKRTSRPMYRWDYVYHGSPVANDVISQIPSQYDLRYKYVTNKTITGTWTSINSSTAGEGFITRVRNIAPFNVTPTPIDFNYVGVPNNGLISTSGTTYDGGLTTAYGNSKLVANPYPCALDAKLFLDDPNNKLYVGGTIYLWTSNTYYIGTGPYSQADYASWNKTGSTGGVPPPGLTPDGKIASGQGFMVQMIADGTLNFKNYMRIQDYNNNFFRLANHSISEESENHRIWLNMTNASAFRQTLIGYVQGATNEEDRSYDGMTLSNSKIDLYSLLNKKELNIQGRAVPFDKNDLVNLGYKTNVLGKLTIAIDHVDGLFLQNQGIYLEDKILNIIHDLKQGPYEFYSEIGTFNNRFVLRYANSTLGTNNPNVNIGLTALIFNKKIKVQASEQIKKIEIYDMTGKLIKDYQPKAASNIFEDDFDFAQGIYLAKVRLENDAISTQKLIN